MALDTYEIEGCCSTLEHNRKGVVVLVALNASHSVVTVEDLKLN